MRNDRSDVGAVEAAYAQMARLAGIIVTPTYLLGARGDHPGFFATQRFDRPRVHVHSLCGLLHADHRIPCLDYADLLRAVRWLTRDQQAVVQSYRRMVFNVIAHNRDDHSRNTAFLMGAEGRWQLAPAYDLTFSLGPGGEHWMTVAGEGRNPQRKQMENLAQQAGIEKEQAKRIIEEVESSVHCWPALAKDMGVSKESIREIQKVIEGGFGH
jgi:serine/threonine-protein kinase HipA